MSRIFYLCFLVSILLVPSCTKKNQQAIYSPNRDRNVCKKMNGKVLMYVVYVDTKGGEKWTETSINNSLNLYKEAADWMEALAKRNNVTLDIEIKKANDNGKGVDCDFPIKNIGAITTFDKKQLKKLNDWTDNVAKKLGASMAGKKPNDSMPDVLNPKDCERLIARLRNQYDTESVALFIETNHAEDNRMCIPLNTLDNDNIERVINSYKNSSVIAYEFLTLFGAEKLFYTKNGHSKKYAEFAAKEFPDDLMTDPFYDLKKANIGAFTKYLIGWENTIDKQYHRLLQY